MATAKKVQKAMDAHIDEKETFVSLQKNFAEGSSVADKLKTLYDLQQADNAIGKIMLLRGELPREVEALEQEIAGLNAKIAHLDEVTEGYQAGIEQYKNDIVETDAEMARLNAQLTNSANSREFDSIQKEIENQGLLRQIAEKNITSARFAIQENKENVEKIREKVTTRQADLDAKKEELVQIVESTSKEEDVLAAKRAELASKVDARTISAYDRIRASVKNHQAVVNVFNNSCGGCFNTVTPQRLIDIAGGQKLVICEHCGRILVNFGADAKSE